MACKVVAWVSHTLDATTARRCNDFAILDANPYSNSTKVVASLRSLGDHDLATILLRLYSEHVRDYRLTPPTYWKAPPGTN
jgi:hypothetical protein